MNSNIEELYKQKYLKYKAKYLNLQRGGVFTQGRNHPKHYALSGVLPYMIDVHNPAYYMALDDKGNIAVITGKDVKIINLRDGIKIKKIERSELITGIAFDSQYIYIGHNGYVEFCKYDNPITFFRLESSSISTSTRMSSSVACKDECVYILSNNKIYVYNKPTLANNSDPNLIINININYANIENIAFDRNGNIVVVDTYFNRMKVLNKKKITFDPKIKNQKIELITTDFLSFGSSGWGPGQFSAPIDFAFNVHGQIIVAERENSRVQILKYPEGTPISVYTLYAPPSGIVVDGNGRILVSTGNTIQALDPTKFVKFPPPAPRSASTPPAARAPSPPAKPLPAPRSVSPPPAPTKALSPPPASSEQKPYLITTSDITRYLSYFKQYDPNSFVDESKTILALLKIEGFKDDLDAMTVKLRKLPETSDFKIITVTDGIFIKSSKKSVNIPPKLLTDSNLKIDNTQTKYKYTVMTAATDAVRHFLRENPDMLKENGLIALHIQPAKSR